MPNDDMMEAVEIAADLTVTESFKNEFSIHLDLVKQHYEESGKQTEGNMIKVHLKLMSDIVPHIQ